VSFPKPHLFLIGLLAVGLTSFVAAKFSGDSEADRFTEETVLLAIPDLAATAPGVPRSLPGPGTAVVAGAAIAVLPAPGPELAFTTTQVRPGDNLANIFKREGIPQSSLQLLLASQPFGPRLKRIFPGHELTFGRNPDSQLITIAYSPGPLDTLKFERVGGGFVGEEVYREPEKLTTYKHATIDHSLFVASQRAGLEDSLTMRIAQIFQWDIDFVLDIRKGDEFYVLYEELYLGDEFVGYGDIRAAEFINQGDSYRAFRYTDSRGATDYYNPEGRNMRKAFLRAPVEFSRISSNFNLRRKHPLYKKTMPHRGIDYAAPTGTPVLAAGDGKIAIASRTGSNGNFVVVQHGEEFVTKYLHLSKFARSVRSGRKVKQGDTIGYVGATGWATGPHLHYEFLVNGVHKNPRTVKLPDVTPIPDSEKEHFSIATTNLVTLLDNYKQRIQLALAR
jgi:murein DD-endopeptidase MepM/ murein hydrolase activator NlpD